MPGKKRFASITPTFYTPPMLLLYRESFIETRDGLRQNATHLSRRSVSVVEKHISFRMSKWSPGRNGLGVSTQTIKLKDYIRARTVKPDLPVVTEICATNALVRTMEWGKDIMGANFYHLIFDQGEPFYGHIKDRKDNRKARKLPELDRITSMTEADTRLTPALQMADLIAWCRSHRDTAPRHKWQNRLLKLNWIDDWFDYDKLVNPVQESIDLVKTWKLPRRRPST